MGVRDSADDESETVPSLNRERGANMELRPPNELVTASLVDAVRAWELVKWESHFSHLIHICFDGMSIFLILPTIVPPDGVPNCVET